VQKLKGAEKLENTVVVEENMEVLKKSNKRRGMVRELIKFNNSIDFFLLSSGGNGVHRIRDWMDHKTHNALAVDITKWKEPYPPGFCYNCNKSGALKTTGDYRQRYCAACWIEWFHTDPHNVGKKKP